MTDERDTTTDAIKALRAGLAYFFPDGAARHGFHLAVDAGTLALALDEFDAARARVAALEAALRDVCEAALEEVNQRISADSHPLVDFLNAHKGEPGHKEAAEAYKWAVYGTAIHAQIALGLDPVSKRAPGHSAQENARLRGALAALIEATEERADEGDHFQLTWCRICEHTGHMPDCPLLAAKRILQGEDHEDR